jgi:hypothetical protein
MKAKAFDCVEMKRHGAEQVQQQIAGMSPSQELDFWRKQTEEIRQRQHEMRERLSLKTRWTVILCGDMRYSRKLSGQTSILLHGAGPSGSRGLLLFPVVPAPSSLTPETNRVLVCPNSA